MNASRTRLQSLLPLGGSLLVWWRHGNVLTIALVGVAAFFAVLAWVSPRLYLPVQQLLDRVTQGLTMALSWSLLAVLYFGLFVPLRFLHWLTGRDFLGPRLAPGTTTYLRPLPPAAADRFDRQY